MHYYYTPPNFTFLANLTTNESGHATYNFTPSQKGYVTFKCNITDNSTRLITAGISNAYGIVAVNDTTPPVVKNVTIEPNQSIEANLNYTNITANITDDIGISGIWITIGLPNGSYEYRNMTNISSDLYRYQYWPHQHGMHNVTVHAIDDPPEYNLNSSSTYYFDVWGKINGVVNQTIEQMVYGITQYQGFNFSIYVNFTNLGPPKGYYINLSVLDDQAILQFGQNMTECGNMSANATCNWTVNVTVPPGTPPLLIKIYGYANWTDPDKIENATYNITNVYVSSNPMMNIIEDEIQKDAPHGRETYVGNITIEADGNDAVQFISLSLVGGNLATDCPECVVTMIPSSWDYLAAGNDFTIDINITVPLAQAPGVYWAKIKATAANAEQDNATLNITIPTNKTWTRTPTTFGTILLLQNTSGSLPGPIIAKNLGNTVIPLRVYRQGNGTGLITSITPEYFDLGANTTRNITVNFTDVGQPQGFYYVNLLIRNDTADPAEQSVDFWLNVTNIPPNITNVTVDPLVFEIIYENVSISATITDNFGVASAWINVTRPGTGNYIKTMNSNGSFYYINYITNISGIHGLRICANDTTGLTGCISVINLTASGTTPVLIESNVTSINITNVTLYSSDSFAFNFTLDPIYVRVFSLTFNITAPVNLSVTVDYFNYTTIYKNETRYNESSVIILNGTWPDTFNVSLIANWINLNGTYGYNVTNITVNVMPNPAINIIQGNISYVILSGNSDNETITIESIGNTNTTNITFHCIQGDVCINFTMNYTPSFIPILPPGNSTDVNITIGVPPFYPAGEEYGYIKANGSGGESDIVIATVQVPLNLSWTQEPSQISKNVSHQTSGDFGEISIHNIGNAYLILDAVKSGDIFPYIEINVSKLYLEIGEYGSIGINYTVPYVSNVTTYQGLIVTSNYTADPPTRTTTVEIIIHPYSVDIISPTEANPRMNVTDNDTIEVRVNVTYGNVPVNNSMVFNLTMLNETWSMEMTLTSVNYSNVTELWHLSFTPPNMSMGSGFDINMTAYYTNLSLRLSDYEGKAIIYRDPYPPQIELHVPERVPANTTARFYVNATDSGAIKNVTIEVTYPNNATDMFDAEFISRNGSVYNYQLNFSNTSQLGIYYVNATAYDLAGNSNYTVKTFEIYPGLWFAGYARDEERLSKPPIVINFTFYLPGTSTVTFNFSSNSTTGYYNETIDAREYEINVDFWEESIRTYNTNLVTSVHDPVMFGKIHDYRTPRRSLKAYYVNTSKLNYSYGEIIFNSTECQTPGNCRYADYISEYLGIYQCSGWTVMWVCGANWTRLDTDVNLTTGIVSANVTSLTGAFALAEYVCGNDVCEDEYGESVGNCPQDCIPAAPIPPIIPGGGGGGALVAAPGAPVVPYEIKTTLIYVTLKQGEYEIHSMEVLNNQYRTIIANFEVEGLIWDFIQLEKTSITIPPMSIGLGKIKIFTLPTTTPGIYTGDIITSIGNDTYRTPVTIRVEETPTPLLDVQIRALTKTVAPGDELKFEVTLLNMGETEKIEDIVVIYLIKNLYTEKVITKFEETLAVEQKLTVRRNITIPGDTPYDRYVIEANVTYWYGIKSASSSDVFDVTQLPLPLLALREIFMNWITYIIIPAIFAIMYGGRRFYAYYREKKRKKTRYIFPLDFKKLPQAGPDAFPVGKIAETDVVAYWNLQQLMTHGISAGSTGAGKSVSSMIVTEELLKRKVPVIVFDPTAQWTGFLRPCRDKHMLDLYPKFGLKPEDSRRFTGRIIEITDPDTTIDVRKYMKPGEITIFLINKMDPAQLDHFVRKTISDIFKIPWPESKTLKLFIAYDEVHRLLPKYGGKGGYVALERGCREFRKWGIGLWLISQVLMDFRGAIRANISSEIQLRTKYTGDIRRVSQKYGFRYSSTISKLKTGTGMVHNAEYNHGKPYFIEFRPLLHDTGRLSEKEINQYIKYDEEIAGLEERVKALKTKGIDTSDLEFELKLARDKANQTMFAMAKTYIDSVKTKVTKLRG
ncbi:MAG: ATP-binding protein [Candidatus Aenigmarchaeota archaeon]|nr:ATP-binding protein [Candidatus Aenigmarchaeota archaeon]